MLSRRDFLAKLLGAATLTTAGLVVPARKTYCFLTDNPLADDSLRRCYLAMQVANRRFIQVPNRHMWGRIALTPENLKVGSRGTFARVFQHVMDEQRAAMWDGLADRNRILL